MAKGKGRKNILLAEEKDKALEIEKDDPWNPVEYSKLSGVLSTGVTRD